MAEREGDASVAPIRGPIVVLLVDDQAFVAAAIGQLLSTERDIELHCCQRPLEAITIANRVHPTVILQDLVMPGLDGLAVMDLFRTNAPTAKTPVVVLSGNDDAIARTRSLAHGAADYLVKPPTKDELVACIRRHVGVVQAAGAVPDDGARDRVADMPPRADQTLDRSVIAAFRRADPEQSDRFVRVLIDQFLQEAATQVTALTAAARHPDPDALHAYAHSLKGAASTIGAHTLAALCGQLERHTARHLNAAVVSVLTSDIEQEFVKVREALAADKRLADWA